MASFSVCECCKVLRSLYNNTLCIFCLENRQRVRKERGIVAKRSHQHVYFIEGGNLIKIGVSYNPEDRLSDLQVGSPVKLTMLLTIRHPHYTEKWFHKRFSHLRSHGEWFHKDPELTNFINGFRFSASVEWHNPPSS